MQISSRFGQSGDTYYHASINDRSAELWDIKFNFGSIDTFIWLEKLYHPSIFEELNASPTRRCAMMTHGSHGP